MSSILCAILLSMTKEVCAYQAVEVYKDHNIHDDHTKEKKMGIVQLGVVVDDVPGEVGLCEQTEHHVREDIDHLVDLIQRSGLSECQFQQQAQVQRHTVDLHEERDHCPGDVHLSAESVHETREYQCMVQKEFP